MTSNDHNLLADNGTLGNDAKFPPWLPGIESWHQEHEGRRIAYATSHHNQPAAFGFM